MESHFHICNRCGAVWKHGDNCKGNDMAHHCPKCGEWKASRHYEEELTEEQLGKAVLFEG